MNKLHVVRFEVIGDSGCYDEGEQEDGTDVKTTFAFYGLAMYHANVLEHGLVNALALARVMEAREQAEQLLRDPWEQRFKDTMKELVRRARRHAGGDEGLVEALTFAADRRNHLAHDFWRVRAEDFCSDAGRAEMITELRTDHERFQETDGRLHDVVMAPLMAKAGVRQEMFDALHTEMCERAEKRDGR
ncbi:hypothetical protein AB0O42_22850 [Streptomyces sp. NPDC089922]|uniref:hypothetical protein n=1 Tax=Streptomyces sp. NPDC089922 TaxID=3155189 RepID=UPI0034429E29